MRMQGYCDVYKWTILKRTSPEVKCLHPTSSRSEMCTLSVSNVIYHKFSHGAAFYTFNGKNINVMIVLDFLFVSEHLNRNLFIPPAYEVCHGGIMVSSFLCVCVCLSVNNFRVRSITLKPLNIFSRNFIQKMNTMRRCAEHTNRNSGFPTFGVIALCVLTIFVSAP